MEPKLVAQDAMEIVGIEIHTAPMSSEIPALWGRFVSRIDEIAGIAEPNVAYGVIGRFDAEGLRMDYAAGVSVKSGSSVPAGMTRLTIPARTYLRKSACSTVA